MAIGRQKIVVFWVIIALITGFAMQAKERQRLFIEHEALEAMDLFDIRTNKMISLFVDLTEQKHDALIKTYRRIETEQVLILFWSLKSKPSINSLLALSHGSKAEGHPIVFGINIDRNVREVTKLVKALNFSFPIIHDHTYYFQHTLNIRTAPAFLPHAVLITFDGKSIWNVKDLYLHNP